MRVTYRQTPTGDHYVIEYRLQANGTYKIFAVECPPDTYGHGPSVHHRYDNAEICVLHGREPRTLDKAKAIAVAWVDGYSSYVRTGVFPTGTRRYNV